MKMNKLTVGDCCRSMR